MGGQVDRGLGDPGTDDEPQPDLVKFLQVRRGQHPGVGHDDHVGQSVALLELLHDRDDRLRLGLVALIAADLEGEPGPVDQKADHDLGVDPALFGEPDLA